MTVLSVLVFHIHFFFSLRVGAYNVDSVTKYLAVRLSLTITYMLDVY